MKCRSEWQSPATEVRIKTSRGPGFGRLTSSITSGLLTSCRTAAFIAVSSFCFISSFRDAPLGAGPESITSNRGYGFRVRSLRSRPGTTTLRGQKQFANLGHADGAVAEEMIRDSALRRIFRDPERIARRQAMIDHQP